MRDESTEESLDAVRFISKICRSSTVFTTAGFLLRFIGDSCYMFYNFFFIGLLLLVNKMFCCVPACRFLTNLLFDAIVLFHFVFGHDHSCIRKWRCVSKLFLSFVKACRNCSFAMLFPFFQVALCFNVFVVNACSFLTWLWWLLSLAASIRFCIWK